MSLTLTSDTTGTVLIRTGYLHRMLLVDSNTSVVQTVGNAVVYFVKLGSANSSGIPLNAGSVSSFSGSLVRSVLAGYPPFLCCQHPCQVCRVPF